MAYGAIGILAILALLFFVLYKRALKETNVIRSMFIMAVLDSEFNQTQNQKILEFLKTLDAKNAVDVALNFIVAFDNMAFQLRKSSILLGAHAALWTAYKEAKGLKD